MFSVYTYCYDADTDCSWNRFEYSIDNLNGLAFETQEQVDPYSTDELSTIHSSTWSMLGILDEGREDFRFVALHNELYVL